MIESDDYGPCSCCPMDRCFASRTAKYLHGLSQIHLSKDIGKDLAGLYRPRDYSMILDVSPDRDHPAESA